MILTWTRSQECSITCTKKLFDPPTSLSSVCWSTSTEAKANGAQKTRAKIKAKDKEAMASIVQPLLKNETIRETLGTPRVWRGRSHVSSLPPQKKKKKKATLLEFMRCQFLFQNFGASWKSSKTTKKTNIQRRRTLLNLLYQLGGEGKHGIEVV